MKKILVFLIALFFIGNFSVTAAELSGNVGMHSRLTSTFSGGYYSENPTMTAEFSITKGLTFSGFFSADLTDSQSLANLQEFIISDTKKIGRTEITGMFEIVNFSALEGVYLYPSIKVAQPLGGGVEINFIYSYFIENINNYDDFRNSSASRIGLVKRFNDWSIYANGYRSGSQTNFGSGITKEIYKNISATGFYHVTDVRGTPGHFGGVNVAYSF